jgi:hypothetical protein
MIFNEFKNLMLDFDIFHNYIDRTFLVTISHFPPKLKVILLEQKNEYNCDNQKTKMLITKVYNI